MGWMGRGGGERGSDGVDGVHFVVGADFVAELDVLVEAVVDEGDGLVDAHRLRELAVRFEVTRLVRRVPEDDVRLGVLVVAQPDQDDVALIDPHFLAQLSSDVAQPLHPVEAHGLESAVAQHFGHLRVLLSVLFEHQLSFLRLVLVLSTTTVLSSLSLILGHVGCGAKADADVTASWIARAIAAATGGFTDRWSDGIVGTP